MPPAVMPWVGSVKRKSMESMLPPFTIRVVRMISIGRISRQVSTNALETCSLRNRLWECGLGIDRLAELGAVLGAVAAVAVGVPGLTGHAAGLGSHSLALVSGFTGVLLSPLHLCLLLSNAYFETHLWPVYRQLALPLAVVQAGGCLYFIILRYYLA